MMKTHLERDHKSPMMKTIQRTILAGSIFITGLSSLQSAVEMSQHRGLYALWYQRKPYREHIFELPYISGGQLVLEWSDIHTGPGQFDLEIIEKAFEQKGLSNKPFTIQFNSNLKPKWLFDIVPHHPRKMTLQVKNTQGSLMYWHPTFIHHHHEFLAAMSKALKSSPHLDRIIGLRVSPNAFGTEHCHVPPKFQALKQWVVPEGSDQTIPLTRWDKSTSIDYITDIVRKNMELFRPIMPVFVRNTISKELEEEFKPDLESGRLSWFHTSSEVEPRGLQGSLKYGRFEDYSKTGKTLAYAEPWASAWGDHGAKRDDRSCSPPQWNYWRLLSDLHCGISFIGVYADDLQVALKGKYTYNKREIINTGPQVETEFNEAFQFAHKYVGTHIDPTSAPGAWVAFRENYRTRRDRNFL
jgi:hypothetical protein